VAVVGSEGTIGRIAAEGLELIGHDVTRIDPYSNREDTYQVDVAEFYEKNGDVPELTDLLSGHDAIVNYGWNTAEENFTNTNTDPRNLHIANGVYQLAHQCDIPIVVQASSIHAGALPAHASTKGRGNIDEMLSRTDEPYRSIIEERQADPEETVSTDRISPDSPYGVTKVNIESMGEYHANPDIQNENTTHYDQPLETVVAIRYGGVNPDDEVEAFLDEEPLYDTIWMGHDDVVRQLNAVLESDVQGFHRMYGVSDNDGNPYSLDNPFGFCPQENAAERIKEVKAIPDL
jgi:hypothetical protein